jgi:hypothetical protein
MPHLVLIALAPAAAAAVEHTRLTSSSSSVLFLCCSAQLLQRWLRCAPPHHRLGRGFSGQRRRARGRSWLFGAMCTPMVLLLLLLLLLATVTPQQVNSGR